VQLFRCSMNGFTSNNKAVPLYCIFHNHNHIGVATRRAWRLQPPVKDPDTLINQSVKNNGQTRQIYKANKDSETQLFNTTDTENYTVQLAVPLQLK